MIGLVPFNHPTDPAAICVGAGNHDNMIFPVATSASIAADSDISGTIDKWGHIFAIRNPSTGQSKLLLSASAYNPLLPSGFTEKQILNSFLVDGAGNICPGVWRADGSFTLNEGAWPVRYDRLALPPPAPHVTYLHLVEAGTPMGLKLNARFGAVGYNNDAGYPPFYGLVLDPDAYPTGRLDGSVPPWSGTADPVAYARVAGTAVYAKPPGIAAWAVPIWQYTDEIGCVFHGSQSGTNNNYGHLYLQGWVHPREPDRPSVSMGILGASLTMDRNANNWLNVAAYQLEMGKTSRVRMMLAGKEGTASNYWISSGWVTVLARVRPHLVIIDMTPDANTGQGISVSQSLANLLTIIDTIRTNNPNVPIFLLKPCRMRADATQFSNVASYYANYATVQANRSNIGIIDAYTPWGDPALNPGEYAASDPIHPLFAGNVRVSIPATVTALSSFIT